MLISTSSYLNVNVLCVYQHVDKWTLKRMILCTVRRQNSIGIIHSRTINCLQENGERLLPLNFFNHFFNLQL